jgi:hypothetical protein
MRSAAFFTVLGLLAVPLQAQAPEEPRALFGEAQSLEGKGRFEAAADLYRDAAAQGHVASKARLGFLYQAGRGVPRDLPMAATLFKDAAAEGNVEAAYCLGLAYLTGSGIGKDAGEARKWVSAAATEGHQRAQLLLGLFLSEGTGGSKNRIAAGRWFDRAAQGPDAGVAGEGARLRDQVQEGANARDEITPGQLLAAFVTAWVVAGLVGSVTGDGPSERGLPPKPPCYSNCMLRHNDSLVCQAMCNQ